MKKTIEKITVLALVLFTTLSFTNGLTVNKEIKTDKSKVVWKGYKVTGSHEGTIAIKSGTLNFEKDKLVSGAIVMDMTSINTTDLEGGSKGKLDGHLKSDDFFGVEKHPTSKLVFDKATASGKNSYNVTGNLTIKGKTNPVTFTISIYGNKATATLKIDRTKYDVRYGSSSFFDNLQDKAIYDDFDLVADLEF